MPSRRALIVLAVLLAAPFCGVGVAAARSHHKRHHKIHHKRHLHQASQQSPNYALPYMGPVPSPSLFGLNTDIYDTNHSLFVQDVPAARGLGARWDRYTIGPATGTGNFNDLDWEVRQARTNGMGVILSFDGIASACSVRPLPSNVGACPPMTAADLSAYAAFVREVVLRYRNVVGYYESWIEPNNESNFIGGPDPATYARLLTAEWNAIQAVNSQYGLNIKLLFGSPIGFSIVPGNPKWTAILPWTQQVLADLHGQKPFDAIGLLAYRFPPGGYGPMAPACDYVDNVPITGGYGQPGVCINTWRWMTWPEELSAYEQVFENAGYGQQPLWLTEWGWPGNAVANGNYFPGELAQSLDLTEAYADLLTMPFVQAAFWFNVRDYQHDLNTPDPTFFYHYGLFNYDLTPKPAALVFKTLALANPGR